MRKPIKISLADFKKLNLKGYKREMSEVAKGFKRRKWSEVDLNSFLPQSISNNERIIVAIHKNSFKALEYEKLWNSTNPYNIGVRTPLPDGFFYNTIEEAKTFIIKRIEGNICIGFAHLFDKNRNVFISKKETEAFYIITN